MIRALLPVALIFIGGCTSIPTPHGQARFWGDYESVSLVDGPVSFHATKMKHSPIVRGHYSGAAGVASQAISGAIGMKQPAMGAGAAILAPAVTGSEVP